MEQKKEKRQTAQTSHTWKAKTDKSSIETDILQALDQEQPLSKRKQRELKEKASSEKFTGGFDDWSVSWP